MRGLGILCAVALLGAGSAGIAADEPPICPDRPGKASSACTVPKGHWQVETGLADWALQNSGGERDTWLVLGATTVKYGLTSRSDIEVDVTPWERASSSGPGFRGRASGFGDLDVVYKQGLTGPDSPLQLAAMPFVKLPTAKRSLGNGKWEGGLLLPIGYALARTSFNIGLTPEVDWAANADGQGHHAAMVQVASLGWAATSKLNLEAEIWGQWDWDPSGTTRQASADASAAYLVNKDLQLDAGANFGLNKATPDVEFYGGISKRF